MVPRSSATAAAVPLGLLHLFIGGHGRGGCWGLAMLQGDRTTMSERRSGGETVCVPAPVSSRDGRVQNVNSPDDQAGIIQSVRHSPRAFVDSEAGWWTSGRKFPKLFRLSCSGSSGGFS